jgi:diacylglycerol kinase (ATP)
MMSTTLKTPEATPDVKRRNVRNFFASIQYSIDGFLAALKHEPSFREDLLFAVLLMPFAIVLPINAVSTAIMVASLLLIIIVELLNSAIEWTIDYLRPERHPLAKRVKDMASAAVFISYLNCIAIWAIILWPGNGVWRRLVDVLTPK